MTKSEQKRVVRLNLKNMFLRAWDEAKADGESLSAFCRDYGLSRKSFYLWLKERNEPLETR
jgi:hypothetical protein